MTKTDWSSYVEEFGEELMYAVLNLKGMDDDMVGHFVINVNEEEYLVSVRKHKDDYYDKLAKKISDAG